MIVVEVILSLLATVGIFGALPLGVAATFRWRGTWKFLALLPLAVSIPCFIWLQQAQQPHYPNVHANWMLQSAAVFLTWVGVGLYIVVLVILHRRSVTR